jgi:hypothetical protein
MNKFLAMECINSNPEHILKQTPLSKERGWV